MVRGDLKEKNLTELRAIAREMGVKNLTKYRKTELMEIIVKDGETPAPLKRGRKPKTTAAEAVAEEATVEEQPVEQTPVLEPEISEPLTETVAETKAEVPNEEPVQEAETSEQTEKPAAGEESQPSRYRPRRTDNNGNQRYQKNTGYTRRYPVSYNNQQQDDDNRTNRRYPNNQNYNTNPDRRFNNAPQQQEEGQRQLKQQPPRSNPNYPTALDEEGKPYYNQEYGTANPAVPKMLETENCPATQGVLEVLPDGYGFLRMENYYSGPKDIYLSITQIRRFNLRTGDYVEGRARPHREGDKFDALMYIDRVNGLNPDENARRKPFEELVPIFPTERFTLEVAGQKNNLSVRIIDLIAPIGKGQRAMVVSQPKAGKTTLLKQIAAGITANYPEAHLMVLLIDERPEEVTDMKRSINGEVIYSTFDELPEHHTRIAEMVQERAMRMVEQGQDVVILLDSLTRLTRAYNLVIPPTGRTLSGGMDPGALHKPKRFFGAARNIENGGSLTVIATALVETGSRMDDIVYEEFKGTGNMEIHLDRKLSEKRIFPAIDIYKSGTRREDLLLSKNELEGVYMLRRMLAGGGTTDVTEQVIPMMQKTSTNEEFLGKLKDWIKIYEHQGYTISNQNRYGN